MRRRLILGVLLCTALACGGPDGPTIITVGRPGPSTVPVPGSGSIAGVVVGNQDRLPIAGARLTANGTVVVTNTNGEFQLSSLPAGNVIYDLSAPNRLSHVSQVNVADARTGVTLDLIPSVEPFSLGFYRQFARDGFDNGQALRAINPWTMAPSFYIRTVTDDTNETVLPEIIDGIRRVIVNSVPELSAGRFTVPALEIGTEVRAPQNGWVVVSFFNTFPNSNAIGDATVGGNGGRMRLAYDAPRRQPITDCDVWVVAVAEHEIVHTMGFYHTGAPFGGGSDFDFNSPGCKGTGRRERTRYHAAVMYSRPPGNVDPDYDPLTFATARAGARPEPGTVSCSAADIRR